MTEYPMSPQPERESSPIGSRPPSYPRRTPPWYVAAVAAVLLIVVALLIVLVLRNGPQPVETATSTSASGTTAATTTTSPTTSADSSTTTTTETTTSSTTTSTSTSSSTTTTTGTSTTIDPAPYLSAVWPWPGSSTRYDDPTAAARGFAEDYVGFDNPVVGPFHRGDSRSGEVEVRPEVGGPLTVVPVRQLGADDTWWVLGSAAADIEIDQPTALDSITSPVQVVGRAVAPSGPVTVELRADGFAVLADDTVPGGQTEPRPFDTSLAFVRPDELGGAVVVTTRAESDGVWAASVVRVRFEPGS